MPGCVPGDLGILLHFFPLCDHVRKLLYCFADDKLRNRDYTWLNGCKAKWLFIKLIKGRSKFKLGSVLLQSHTFSTMHFLSVPGTMYFTTSGCVTKGKSLSFD